ncbi:MAG: STAS/SEC14 domain-containing protein [Chloroflexota bacterium]
MQPSEKIQYTLLNDDIHDFCMLESSNPAVDDLIVRLSDVLAHHPEGQTLRLLINTSQSGSLPLAHVINSVRPMVKEFRSNVELTRLAFVYQNPKLISVWTAVFSVLPTKIEMNAFPAAEREAAIAWLTEE